LLANGRQVKASPAARETREGLAMKEGYVEALEARVNAHRRVLTVLMRQLPEDARQRLLAELNEPYPPQDGQEDPGAVPVDEFGAIAAFAAEVRTIIEPLKQRS
jgi:hypothetical protein